MFETIRSLIAGAKPLGDPNRLTELETSLFGRVCEMRFTDVAHLSLKLQLLGWLSVEHFIAPRGSYWLARKRTSSGYEILQKSLAASVYGHPASDLKHNLRFRVGDATLSFRFGEVIECVEITSPSVPPNDVSVSTLQSVNDEREYWRRWLGSNFGNVASSILSTIERNDLSQAPTLAARGTSAIWTPEGVELPPDYAAFLNFANGVRAGAFTLWGSLTKIERLAPDHFVVGVVGNNLLGLRRRSNTVFDDLLLIGTHGAKALNMSLLQLVEREIAAYSKDW